MKNILIALTLSIGLVYGQEDLVSQDSILKVNLEEITVSSKIIDIAKDRETPHRG